MKKFKFLLSLVLLPLLLSCSKSGLTEDEVGELIDQYNSKSLVEVVVNFVSPIPDNVVEIDIWLDSCYMADGSRVTYSRREFYKNDFASTMKFIMNSAPEYYGQPIERGTYIIGLNRGDGYYYTVAKEFNIKELSKYSKLEYDFEGVGPARTSDYYDRGTGKLKLKSSVLR